jgi:hypothetical protein
MKKDRKLEEKLKVRLLQEKPPVSLYICDKRGWLGFFREREISSKHPQIEFSTKGDLGESMIAEFEKLWRKYSKEEYSLKAYPAC